MAAGDSVSSSEDVDDAGVDGEPKFADKHNMEYKRPSHIVGAFEGSSQNSSY